MNTGTVKFFNAEKHFGFITRDSGGDLFFHISEVQGQPPREGDKVEFEVGQGKKVLALSVLRSKETKTESEEKNPRSMSDLRFQSAFLYLRRHTENRVEHQDLSCRSCSGAEASDQYRSARPRSFSE